MTLSDQVNLELYTFHWVIMAGFCIYLKDFWKETLEAYCSITKQLNTNFMKQKLF